MIGKPIGFIDKQGATRINVVIAVHGNTITTENILHDKERIHPQINKIFGHYLRTENNTAIYEPIEFNQERVGKRMKSKIALKEIKNAGLKSLKGKRRRPGRPRKVK